MFRICIPLQASKSAELFQLIKKAQVKADIIEVWLDSLVDLQKEDIKKAVEASQKPLLFVCKGKKEKGKWLKDEKSRVETLVAACSLGADFVDIGIHTNKNLIENLKRKKRNTKLIISYHNFVKTPNLKNLQKTCEKAIERGADIVKIATHANDKVDNYTIFELIVWFKSVHPKKQIIALCMGKNGVLSRIHAPEFGAFLTFAALNKAKITAPGQLTVEEIKKKQSLA